MNQPSKKGQNNLHQEVADAIAGLDIDQQDREEVAEAVAAAFAEARSPYFRRDLFVLLASDPLVPCAGFDDQPCPENRRIRVMMHLSSAPDGRSKAWRRRRPEVRCVRCGARMYVPGYPAEVEL